METRVVYLDKIPDMESIKSILGTSIFECYECFCNMVISLSPKIETWSGKSRRGMFFHGFDEFPKTDLKYIHIWINESNLNCEVHLSKRKYDRIVQNKDKYCADMKEFISGSVSTYLCFSLSEKIWDDVISILR